MVTHQLRQRHQTSPAKTPKIAVEFNNNIVDNSDYFTTSTFNDVVRTQVGNFFIVELLEDTVMVEVFRNTVIICTAARKHSHGRAAWKPYHGPVCVCVYIYIYIYSTLK